MGHMHRLSYESSSWHLNVPKKEMCGNFLEGLQVNKEELVQVGVVIDDKDYLSTIISSLPIALSNFASAQLATTRMFAPTKSIKPKVLISLLVEEANHQKAQQECQRVSEKERKDDNKALVAEA